MHRLATDHPSQQPLRVPGPTNWGLRVRFSFKGEPRFGCRHFVRVRHVAGGRVQDLPGSSEVPTTKEPEGKTCDRGAR